MSNYGSILETGSPQQITIFRSITDSFRKSTYNCQHYTKAFFCIQILFLCHPVGVQPYLEELSQNHSFAIIPFDLPGRFSFVPLTIFSVLSESKSGVLIFLMERMRQQFGILSRLQQCKSNTLDLISNPRKQTPHLIIG